MEAVFFFSQKDRPLVSERSNRATAKFKSSHRGSNPGIQLSVRA
jgi:hypothetical protein